MSEDEPTTDRAGDVRNPDEEAGRTPGAGASDRRLWERVRHLEWEARWFAAKCDELRHGCRGMLDAIGSTGPLTPERARLIETDPPTRSSDDVFVEYRRLRDEKAAGPGAPPAGATAGLLAARVAELERDVAVLSARREELKAPFLALADVVCPYEPVTEAEVRELLSGTSGASVAQILDDVERELRAGTR